MNLKLDSIVPSSRLHKYIIKYTPSNGDQKYVKMRFVRYTKNSVYVRCSSTLCKARLSIKILAPELIVQTAQKSYKINEEATDDSICNTDNYGAIEHNCRECSSSKDAEGRTFKIIRAVFCLFLITQSGLIYRYINLTYLNEC